VFHGSAGRIPYSSLESLPAKTADSGASGHAVSLDFSSASDACVPDPSLCVLSSSGERAQLRFHGVLHTSDGDILAASEGP
jgi:hypothetical protein